MQEVKCFFFTHEMFCSASFAELGDNLSFMHAGQVFYRLLSLLLGMLGDWGSQVRLLAVCTHPVDAADGV